MLTMLLAFLFVVTDPIMKKLYVKTIPTPQMLGIDKSKCEVVVDLNPRWQVADLNTNHNYFLNQAAESNWEAWQKGRSSNDIAKCIPQKAVTARQEERVDEHVYLGLSKQHSPARTYGLAKTTAFFDSIHYHKPWHLALQSRWPQYFNQETVLQYEVIKHPISSQPDYIGIVCSMPNIRCKAETVEELEKQLLKQYAEYLITLDENIEDQTKCQRIEGEDNWRPPIIGLYDRLDFNFDY